jgi:hypothetical protein
MDNIWSGKEADIGAETLGNDVECLASIGPNTPFIAKNQIV